MGSTNIALPNHRIKGMALVIIGASMWGVSGTVAQYLMQQQGFTPAWLVDVRLLISGTILLILASSKKDSTSIWEIWKNKSDALNLILFSILGMVAVQYTFFEAINRSNAATATVLQYLAPLMISVFIALKAGRLPNSKEMIAVALALVGTFLLVTRGNIHSLSITGTALFWGLLSAVALAFYTLNPIKLLAKYGSILVIGWGMLIGGLSFSFIHPPWNFEGQWSLSAVFAFLFIVIFGTLIAFYCYLESLKYINASETSLLACIEPLSAAMLSVVWLQVSFGLAEWLGTLCILSTIMILSLIKNNQSNV